MNTDVVNQFDLDDRARDRGARERGNLTAIHAFAARWVEEEVGALI